MIIGFYISLILVAYVFYWLLFVRILKIKNRLLKVFLWLVVYGVLVEYVAPVYKAILKLCKIYGGNVDLHHDDRSLSWRIPSGYKVIKAELRNSKGTLICSNKKNPMHLWPYSPSFKGTV